MTLRSKFPWVFSFGKFRGIVSSFDGRQTRLRSEQNMLILFSTYAAHIEKKYQVKENPHDMTLAGEMGNK